MDFQNSVSPTEARAWLWNSGKNLPGQTGLATPLSQEVICDAYPPGVFLDSTMLMTLPLRGSPTRATVHLVDLPLWGKFARLPGFLMRKIFQGTGPGPMGKAISVSGLTA